MRHGLWMGYCVFMFGVICGMQRLPIFVDVNALIDHSESKKTSALARRLDGFYVPWASDALIGRRLWKACDAVASVRERAAAREREAHVGYCDLVRSGHLKFYALMDDVVVTEDCPVIYYKGDVLPPIMAAWAWGSISTDELIRRTHEHIESFACDGDSKNFLRELVYVAFAPEVMKTTCVVNPQTQAILERLRKTNFPAYLVLIGHCNPAIVALMHEHSDGAAVMPLFDKIVFSHQVRDRVTSETPFTDETWRTLAGVGPAASVGAFAMPHIFIDDDARDGGKSVVQPWHYTSASKELKTLIENIKIPMSK